MSKIVAGVLIAISIAIFLFPSKSLLSNAETDFMNWATSPKKPGQVTRTWAVANLNEVLQIVAVYFILVSIGLLIKKQGEEEGKVSPMVDTPVKGLQLIYNLVQCILCSYMIWKAIEHYINHHYSLICNPFHEKETGMAEVLHIFYLSKILDFCDTLFIVLRQKWKQMSFLHVYHHASIFLVYWMNNYGGYDGDIYLTVVLNSFVHLVMYSYYFLATLGYSAWWKNYITLLQMGQFLMMNAQAIYILYFGCPFPQNITWLYLIYIISLFILFQNFYRRTYNTGKRVPRDTKKKQ